MSSTLADCIGKKVRDGLIRAASAKKMQAVAGDLEQRYLKDGMGPTEAVEAALTEAARIFKETAERKRYIDAKHVLATKRVQAYMMEHPKGASAGAMATLVRDIWDTGIARDGNVETQTEVIYGQLQKRFASGLDAYKSKAAGLVQDKVGVRNLVRELFGVDTGDTKAAQAAREWKETATYAVDRFKRAGGELFAKENWRLPQVHNAEQIAKAGFEPWRDFMLPLLDDVTWQRIAPGSGLTRDDVMREIYDSITLEMTPRRGKVASGINSHNARRFFEFKDAENWLAYNDRFGAGPNGIFDLLTGHMQSMARDTAIAEIMGPKPTAILDMMVAAAEKEARDNPKPLLQRAISLVEGPKAVRRTYDVLSGALGGRLTGTNAIIGGVRNFLSAKSLGAAIISAVPSDSVLAAFSAKMIGADVGRMMGRVLNGMSEEEAMRMGIVASSIADGGFAGQRFQDELYGRGFTRHLASFVIRAQGLTAWTDRLKRTAQLEIMGTLADAQGTAWGDLKKPIKNMLKRHGLSPADWRVIQQAPLGDANGAKFLVPDLIEDQDVAERLQRAIIEERQFFVLEPDARVRQITTGGYGANTFAGQAVRSLTMFRSFAITMLTTHAMRAAIQAGIGNKVIYGGSWIALLTLSGAMTIQARALISGKDPRPMNTGEFWGAAALQGGALGFFGDFLSTAVGRGGETITTALAGPVGGFANDLARLTFQNLRQKFEGEPVKFGAELARFVRYNTPVTNLAYTRLVLDRVLWDQVQRIADPSWQRSFARMERQARKDYGQRFWWGPGDATPQRAPDLGNVAGP